VWCHAVSDEQDEVQRLRLDAAMRRVYAKGRNRLRWWKHTREYVSLLRLVKNGLLRAESQGAGGIAPAKDGIPQHPPWKHPDWRWNTPDGKAPFRY